MKEPGANEELLSLIIVSHHYLERPLQDSSSNHNYGGSWVFKGNPLLSEIRCFETRISYTMPHTKNKVLQFFRHLINCLFVCIGIIR